MQSLKGERGKELGSWPDSLISSISIFNNDSVFTVPFSGSPLLLAKASGYFMVLWLHILGHNPLSWSHTSSEDTWPRRGQRGSFLGALNPGASATAEAMTPVLGGESMHWGLRSNREKVKLRPWTSFLPKSAALVQPVSLSPSLPRSP